MQVLGVVKRFQATEIPPPRVLAVAHETLVAHTMNGGLGRAHADHGVRSPLPRGPGELEQVQAALVADLAPYGVRGLGNGVSVEGKEVVLLDKDIEGPANERGRRSAAPDSPRGVQTHLSSGFHAFFS